MSYKITKDCIFCDTCRTLCPNDAIKNTYPLYSIDQERCTACGICFENCRTHAIVKINKKENY